MIAPADIPRPERVLIIKPSALGDVVTALPVLRGLRREFPEAQIDWLANPSCAPLVDQDEQLSHAVLFDRRRFGRMVYDPAAAAAFVRFCRQLRRTRYDWAIDLQGLFRSGFLAAVTRAPVRAGFATAREFAGLFYNHALPADRTPVHTVDRNIALARHLGVDARPEDYRLSVPAAARKWAKDFVENRGESVIVVAPATRWVTKLYPARHWRVVIEHLSRRAPVVLVAGPGEEHLTAPLTGGENVIDLTGRTTVAQLVGLIAEARLLVCCDSAAMNIAGAVATPQVVLTGPTDPARTGPYGDQASIVQTSLPCRGCLKRKCRHISCMQTIDPAEVVAAAEQRLSLI